MFLPSDLNMTDFFMVRLLCLKKKKISKDDNIVKIPVYFRNDNILSIILFLGSLFFWTN